MKSLVGLLVVASVAIVGVSPQAGEASAKQLELTCFTGKSTSLEAFIKLVGAESSEVTGNAVTIESQEEMMELQKGPIRAIANIEEMSGAKPNQKKFVIALIIADESRENIGEMGTVVDFIEGDGAYISLDAGEKTTDGTPLSYYLACTLGAAAE